VFRRLAVTGGVAPLLALAVLALLFLDFLDLALSSPLVGSSRLQIISIR